MRGSCCQHRPVTERRSYIQLLSASDFSLGTFAVVLTQLNIFPLVMSSTSADMLWHWEGTTADSPGSISCFCGCAVGIPVRRSLLNHVRFWENDFNQHVSASLLPVACLPPHHPFMCLMSTNWGLSWHCSSALLFRYCRKRMEEWQ